MKQRIAVAAILLIAVVALAGPIKVWSAGEVITANDLNANFQHIHNVMVGGHGARLMNVDVNASAGISHSKLATPALLPKVVAGTYSPCDGGTCYWNVSSGLGSTFTRGAIGQYTVTFASARSNANYIPIVTAVGEGTNSPYNMHCGPVPTFSTTAFGIQCGLNVTDGGGLVGPADLPFSVVVFDDNN